MALLMARGPLGPGGPGSRARLAAVPLELDVSPVAVTLDVTVVSFDANSPLPSPPHALRPKAITVRTDTSHSSERRF